MRQIRQGDVLLVRVDGYVPETAWSEVPRENGLLVLAHGEVTGHIHAIADERARLVTDDEAAELYLIVNGTEAVALTHQEHDGLAVDPGLYRVVRQREYAPTETQGWDWVCD